ncbi:response regulator transcription factor [Enterococcus hulanensis]|uniref:Response regulator transcription factor n=1 Tax=Enterococcus hulanensis TaxID=2559929 RepID=A0ABU3EXM6_9ENTE|nr:response regulator transcription factor [Enterococcus hulanensis]MDT2599618.1 response regulator transcription factor [Enterococcus hulanensis]MDT2609526.1 response regulator transcription factor [Enterococcus hulanensis]MDT2616103.1 response regulator transcription factor [Enterococcus hulanensis]MDT2627857.1 response regulator transcription factor [Enterococcus hulanensis]MDT2654962.1 response regulator transcription factor [Enterococcus hulanensis]
MNIMIIEDEAKIRSELAILLKNALYDVSLVEDFSAVEEQVKPANPDLILMDIHLPGRDGNELCGAIRQSLDVPIIFLTSETDVMSETNSMLMGGDDYITKPYHPSVLLARISAVLKRSGRSKADATLLKYKGVSLDTRAYKVSTDNQAVELSKNEFKLLHYLFLHQSEVVSRLDLIEYLWDNDVFIDDNSLSVTVNRIRSRLAEIGVTDFIETKRGVGYKI